MSDCSATPERIDQCPATPDRSASAVKSPEPSVSPPPNCPICLGKCRNQCFTDSCLHKFCFKCLLEWSKVKPECPLCKQSFKSIIHNVKSIDQFEEYLVQQPQPPIPVILPLSSSDGQRSSQHNNNSRGSVSEAQAPSRLFAHRFDVFLNDISRLRSGVYGAHLQVNPDSAFQQLMLNRPSMNNQYQQQFPNDIITTGNMLLLWRQYIYDRRLYALPVVDITGRYRECSARFYRNNPAQIHRLMPWLNRDLACLLRDSPYDVSFVLHIIGQLITVYNINSVEFRKRCTVYFGSRTSHFIHEFLTFARSPYDMVGYDRQARYAPYEEIVISSSSNTSSASESDDGAEVPARQLHTYPTPNPANSNNIARACPQESQSIILELLADAAATVASANREHTYALPQPSNTIASSNLSRVDNIVLSSGSTSDECEFVMEQKPPHLRTPELVSLHSESDSDVIFVSEDKPKVEKAVTRSLRSASGRRPPTPYYNFSSDEENTTSLRKPPTPFGKSSSEDNTALSVLKKEFQGIDNRSNNNGNQGQVKPSNNDTTNNNSKRGGGKDEYNNGASTSASISYLNKSRIKPERPLRLYYKKKRKAIKSIFESSSSDEDTKKEYKNYKLKNNRSGNVNSKNNDDDVGNNDGGNGTSTETYHAPDSDTDDSSWSQSKNSSRRYQKRHKLSKKRRSEMLKKRLKKELEKV